jgi:predicted CXXCH cytochrome family protein
MRTLQLTWAVLAFLAYAGAGFAADVIVLPAESGKVIFTHRKHQEAVKDCTACHMSAPGKMRNSGQYRPHTLCIGCHEKKKSGPVNCVGCHSTSDTR